jgi:NAD(P)-dependent dehydrogenase (short-subunit alcohol dehydrogenase family)
MSDSNKIAVVTGSSRGLGKSTALNLAKKGVDVIVMYHSNAEEAAKVVAEIESIGAKAVALQLDTANTKTFDSFVEQVKQSLQDKWLLARSKLILAAGRYETILSLINTSPRSLPWVMWVFLTILAVRSPLCSPKIING